MGNISKKTQKKINKILLSNHFKKTLGVTQGILVYTPNPESPLSAIWHHIEIRYDGTIFGYLLDDKVKYAVIGSVNRRKARQTIRSPEQFFHPRSTNSKLSKRKDGLYIDPTFERNYAECKRVGLPVGVYYYTYATTKAMADAELAVLKTALAGKTFEMPVCVDVEDNKLVKLNKGSLTALVDYELRTLESWSVYALLYTGLNFSLTRLNMAKLKAYDVWVAAYRKSMKKPATSYKYGIWQYTDEARIPGVRTNADMSYAYKDYPAIIERAGLSRVKGA